MASAGRQRFRIRGRRRHEGGFRCAGVCRSGSGAGWRAAFTLLEILLVVSLILLMSGLAIPAILRSFRGERLRVAARSFAASHRLARSLALLRTQPIELYISVADRLIEVRASADGTGEAELEEATGAAPEERDRTEPLPSQTVESQRVWAEGVRLDYLSIEGQEAVLDAPLRIRYGPDGRVPAFVVRFVDERGDRIELRSDPWTGRLNPRHEQAR